MHVASSSMLMPSPRRGMICSAAAEEVSMDVARPKSVIRNKKIKRLIYVALFFIAASVVTLGLSRMSPAAPTVEGATLWPDTVKRGEMLRQVRGLGTLVPEEVRWIPATTDGIIEDRKARAGDTVTTN